MKKFKRYKSLGFKIKFWVRDKDLRINEGFFS